MHSPGAGCLKQKKGLPKEGEEPYRQRGPRVQHRCVGEVETGTKEMCDPVGEPDVAEAVPVIARLCKNMRRVSLPQ